VLSPHDPNILYAAGNHVFRSNDEGTTWDEISPDLTRNDQSRMASSGGPLTQDNTGAEYYGTVFAFAESPVERGVLWAGSDDGLVHISRDQGKTWSNVTPAGLPEWTLVSIIEASPHDAACAYLAATRYKLDDFAPYLFKTSDYGASWTPIRSNLPDNVFTRAIREDPTRRGLLYAGTETGVYVSFDDGASWASLQGNLPTVPIHDLVVKEPEGDLLLATHGRSFWVLDDLGPVRAYASDTAQQPVVLFKPRSVVRFASNGGFGSKPTRGKNYRMPGALMVTYRQREDPRTGDKEDVLLDAAKNPPDGAAISYYLAEQPAEDITLTFLEADGREIRTFSSKNVDDEKPPEDEPKKPREPRIPREAGLNRWTWNLRYPDATKIEDDDASNELVEGGIPGPLVPPGSYRVRLSVGSATFEETFEVRKDPRLAASDADLRAQFDQLLSVRDKLSAVHGAVNQLRAVRRRAQDWSRRARDKPERAKVLEAAQAVIDRLKPIEAELIQVEARGRADQLNLPAKLNGKLAALAGTIANGDGAPTRSQTQVYGDLERRVNFQIGLLEETIATEVEALNQAIQGSGLAPVGT
jgi:hypothetical protein